jgi:hypothetical protein
MITSFRKNRHVKKKKNLKIALKNPLPESFSFILEALRLAPTARGTGAGISKAPP